MVNINKAFTTRDEAEKFVEAYLRSYHPCGYGTSLKITASQDGTWLVTGYRYRSCD